VIPGAHFKILLTFKQNSINVAVEPLVTNPFVSLGQLQYDSKLGPSPPLHFSPSISRNPQRKEPSDGGGSGRWRTVCETVHSQRTTPILTAELGLGLKLRLT